MSNKYIAVDFDGTLCKHFTNWQGVTAVIEEEPVPEMLARVKRWIARGVTVKILTARMSCAPHERDAARTAIQDWLEKYNLPRLEVTNQKTFGMMELWDDRAIQVERDMGRPVDPRQWKR
jgi:hypothetical protein